MAVPGRSKVPDRVCWAVEQLALRPTEHVLEIGAGSGLAVAQAAEQLPRGSVTAIDRSALQVQKARALNRALIAAGKTRVERLSLEQAPELLGEGRFTKVFAINVNAFWVEPVPSLASVRRVLQRKGSVYLVYEPPSAAKLRELERTLPPLLREAGFVAVECRAATAPLRFVWVRGAVAG